jgi:hypothetical protein
VLICVTPVRVSFACTQILEFCLCHNFFFLSQAAADGSGGGGGNAMAPIINLVQSMA